MRILIALILFGLAAWRAVIDWQNTIGEGAAYRLANIETVWAELSPITHEAWMPRLQEAQTPILWSPLGETLMTLPAALVLLVCSVFF